MYPGEYPQPQNRSSVAEATLVSGYAGIRFRVGPASLLGSPDCACQAILENVGCTPLTVQIETTADHSPTGVRTLVGSAIAIVPHGHATVDFLPARQYVEFWGTAGAGKIKVQIVSQLKFELMAFSKMDVPTYDVLDLTEPENYVLGTPPPATTDFGATGSATSEVTS